MSSEQLMCGCQINVLSSARGQSYAEELRQLYDSALHRQRQSLGHHHHLQRHQQQQQYRQRRQPAAAASRDDDDELSVTTTSTSTAMTTADDLCWRCCGLRASEDAATNSLRGRRTGLGLGNAAGMWRSGRCPSTLDGDSAGSCNDDFATVASTPTTSQIGGCGAPPAVLPDVANLAFCDEKPGRGSGARRCDSIRKPNKDNAPVISPTACHSAR